MRSIRRVRRPLVALVALLVALAIGYAVRHLGSSEQDGADPSPSASQHVVTGTVALTQLPRQVAQTVIVIRNGGPFPYPRNDGAVFHNNERKLPREPDGYYHEYTVPTPGSHDRGSRRLVTGRSEEFWYTGNHYESFEKVDVQR